MSKKILIVDDEEDFLKAVEIRLEHSGMIPFSARDGVEAMKLVEKAPPDLILLDVQMPKMDGLEFIGELKKHDAYKEIPVIFLTAGRFDISEEYETLALGNDFMLKSVDDDQLIERIEKLLE